MKIYVNFDAANSRDLLNEARDELVTLLAEERQLNRELEAVRAKISEYEGYAAQAIAADKQELALEIADRVAELEKSRDKQLAYNQAFSDRVETLKRSYNRARKRAELPVDRWQHIIDRLDAAAELNGETQWVELDRKMREAGIKRDESDGERVLARIKARAS